MTKEKHLGKFEIENGVLTDVKEKPLNFKSWIGKDITKEKPLIEKAQVKKFNNCWIKVKDVAHDIGRIKEVFKDGMLFEGGSIKKIINEIIGELEK